MKSIDDDLMEGLWRIICFGKWTHIEGASHRGYKHKRLELTTFIDYFDERYTYQIKAPKWSVSFVIERNATDGRILAFNGTKYKLCSDPVFTGDKAVIAKDIVYATLLG